MNIIKPIAVFAALTFSSAAFAQASDLARENYQQADANGDTFLTYDEFVTFIELNAADGIGNAARLKARNMFQTAFGRVDANGDGSISPEELQALR
ncbi:MAG: hypothetical protein AAFP80_05705 [Pseudomonadota bacterium]